MELDQTHLGLKLLELFFLLLSVFVDLFLRFAAGVLYSLRAVWRGRLDRCCLGRFAGHITFSSCKMLDPINPSIYKPHTLLDDLLRLSFGLRNS